MEIGIPVERNPGEYRVGLTPQWVRQLTQEGHRCYVERGAGEGAGGVDENSADPSRYSSLSAFEADFEYSASMRYLNLEADQLAVDLARSLLQTANPLLGQTASSLGLCAKLQLLCGKSARNASLITRRIGGFWKKLLYAPCFAPRRLRPFPNSPSARRSKVRSPFHPGRRRPW